MKQNNFLYKILASRWLGLGGVFITYLYLLNLQGQQKSLFLWLTNLVIIIISCVLIYSDSSKSVSIIKVAGIFFLLFFGISPVIEYKTNTLYWGGGEMPESVYVFTNILIILSLLAFLFVYKISLKYSSKSNSVNRTSLVMPKNFGKFDFRCSRLFITALLFFLLFLYFNNFNFLGVLTRGGEFAGAAVIDNKALGLIVNNFVRPFCFSAFLLLVFLTKEFHFKHGFWIMLLFPIALFACFPVALPRFAVAALYIPLILVLFPSVSTGKFLPANTFVLSFVTIFPLLDIFRYADEDFSLDQIAFNPEFFVAGHFDAYQNFVRTVSLQIVTYGEQIVGAILFWVPRAFWADKPVGSGELIAAASDLNLSNISQSLPAEGYINFGIVGVLIFMMIFAGGAALLDSKFWYREMTHSKTFFTLYYFQLIGLTIFILRGDMVNGVAYTTGFLSSMVFAKTVFNAKRLKLKVR